MTGWGLGARGAERVFIGLGSNVGNRVRWIDLALDWIEEYTKVVATSFLYESKPMYVETQGTFLNAVVEVETSLEPRELLQKLKDTERALGRNMNGLRYGPRRIDLDVLMYGNRTVMDNACSYPIQVPHPKISERPFVLLPLFDIDPQLHVPGIGCISKCISRMAMDETLMRVTPLADGTLLKWGDSTLLMGIVNVTPDSFSDGGESIILNDALAKVGEFRKAGFHVVDIGGCSTRPGASPVSEDIELQRVLPVVRAIRDEYPDIAISIDTFRGAVARQAVSQGAGIINDVGAGRWCADMIGAVRDTRACWVAMHSRGMPDMMMTQATYKDVVEDAARELGKNVQFALSQGVYRWNVMIDGGIGFAKSAKHNVQLIRGWSRFKSRCAGGGYPTLLGLSRKSFLSTASRSGASARERDWATAGALGAGIYGGGVDMVRVHSSSLGDAIRGSALIREKQSLVRAYILNKK